MAKPRPSSPSRNSRGRMEQADGEVWLTVAELSNQDVARILKETAALLEVDGAPVHRFRSYERGAQIVESLTEPVARLIAEDRFTALPGIGDRLQEHTSEILRTGKLPTREKLLKKFSPGILDILKLQGLGPKKVAILWAKFKTKSPADVGKLAERGKLRGLAGFGEKTEQNILKAVAAFATFAGRFHQHKAAQAAEQLIAYINELGKKVERVEVAGSLRRGRETIGDLDILVQARTVKDKAAVHRHLLAYPEVERTLAAGEDKTSVQLAGGMQVDVRVLDAKSYGAALLYFTGSKAHNVAIRGMARERGWTLNEYALTTIKGGKFVAGRTEEDIYKKLGMAWIAPEMREATGEIELASVRPRARGSSEPSKSAGQVRTAGGRGTKRTSGRGALHPRKEKTSKTKLPELVELADMRGDLQMHTTASDGKNSIEEMARAAKKLGYGYIALTDHSKAVTVANGLDEKRMLAHMKKIRAADKVMRGFRILAGVEVDILKNGALDLDLDVLRQLDVVVGSVHSYMNQDSAEMTDRLLAAIESGAIHILGHPTGRLLLKREPFRFDRDAVFDACKRHGVAVESNAAPQRLDLRDVDLRAANEKGCKIVISTDAHSTAALGWMKYGVRTARRAWLTKNDVLNTFPAEAFLKKLSAKKKWVA